MHGRFWPSERGENNFAQLPLSIGWHWLSERLVRCHHVKASIASGASVRDGSITRQAQAHGDNTGSVREFQGA